MRKLIVIIPIIVCALSCKKNEPKATIYTTIGSIEITLFLSKAPLTVQNFITYSDAKLYDNTRFLRTCTPENEADRTVKIEVIQGGHIDKKHCNAPIVIETTQQTGILHDDGILSMARDTPNSAQSDFFICIGKQASLDYMGKRNPDGYGFAAFGKVNNGMKVVRQIHAMDNYDQMLIMPIIIDSIRIYY